MSGNPVIAKLYGGGMNKTASASAVVAPPAGAVEYLNQLVSNAPVAQEDTSAIDLNTMSAAQFLAGLEDEMSQTQEPQELDKVASAVAALQESGDFTAVDTMGRIMAHAFHDELSKLASAPAEGPEEPEFIPLENLTAAQMLEMMNSGEYEIVKTASVMQDLGDAVSHAGRAVKDGAGRVVRGVKDAAVYAGDSIKNGASDLATNRSMRNTAIAAGSVGAGLGLAAGAAGGAGVAMPVGYALGKRKGKRMAAAN